ncbi:MAG: FAD-binding protein [Parachlamydia sp.]|nr:FAD-binding protein [Parachlamydia sp.]
MTYNREVWGKYSAWHPQQVIYPSDLEQLQEAVRSAGSNMRAAGSLHSMNDICATPGIQIHTDELNQLLELKSEKVKVQGGIKIWDLQEQLRLNGLTLPNQGYIREQSIAGATATATHGSSLATGTLSSFIEEIELVEVSGILRRLSPQNDAHLFSAAVVSLGCLGVIYSLTLRCIPDRNLHLTKAKGRLVPTLEQLPALLTENDYFQFMISPYDDTVMTFGYRRTEEACRKEWGYRARRLIVKALAVSAMDLFYIPAWFAPQLFRILATVSPIDCIGPGEILSPADEGHYVEQEIAVPLDKLEEALAVTRGIVDHYSSRSVRPLILQLIRFAKKDLYGYLSPALDRDTAYISHISIAKEGYMELFKDVEMALYAFEGRPHWGKVHFLTKERAMQLYGNNYTLFREARQQLDPSGRFSNAYTDRIFRS